MYCRRCRKWDGDIPHWNCPRGEKKSLLWVDIANAEMGCNRCNRVWAIEDTLYHCSCGNAQRIQYVDTVISLKEGDQVIATDGDLVYVLTRLGVVVVGYRKYLGVGY